MSSHHGRRGFACFVPTPAECDQRRKARHERSTREVLIDRTAKENPMNNATATDERVHLQRLAATCEVPEHLRLGLASYVVDGIRPGGFLVGCLANDALTAVRVSDPESRAGMGAVLHFIAHYVPQEARGSFGAVELYAETQRARRAAAQGAES